jgi:hypothetical protein
MLRNFFDRSTTADIESQVQCLALGIIPPRYPEASGKNSVSETVTASGRTSVLKDHGKIFGEKSARGTSEEDWGQRRALTVANTTMRTTMTMTSMISVTDLTLRATWENQMRMRETLWPS